VSLEGGAAPSYAGMVNDRTVPSTADLCGRWLRQTDRRAIARALGDWYRADRRDLPWRRSRDPYAVWVSEVMLQQTQVATALPYYERWMQRFPTVHDLARSTEDDVLHAWQGLGYYSRAKSLLAGARAVVEQHAGRVPSDVEALLDLPGVGPYSAGAIASIAYGVPAPIVDGNVTRVLARLFALRGDPARAPLKHALWDIARALIPRDDARDFNQALMELGATLCSPRRPDCAACPLRRRCKAHRAGTELEFPETRARPKPTAVHMVAAVVERDGKMLVVRVPAEAPRWASMWQFPNAEVAQGERTEDALSRAVRDAAGLDVQPRGLIIAVRHGVTRYRITLDAYRCSATPHDLRTKRPASALEAIRWATTPELDSLAMPAAHRRVALALARRTPARRLEDRR
jgi:A/G-specific adenine glycosylase